MAYDVFSSSPKIAEQTSKKRIGQVKYPWKNLQVGQSFAVPSSEVKFASLRSQASIVGKRLGRKFVVIEHKEAGVYEVGLIAILIE